MPTGLGRITRNRRLTVFGSIVIALGIDPISSRWLPATRLLGLLVGNDWVPDGRPVNSYRHRVGGRRQQTVAVLENRGGVHAIWLHVLAPVRYCGPGGLPHESLSSNTAPG